LSFQTEGAAIQTLRWE